MADGIYAALSGAAAQSRAMEVISNNLANVSTAGFKRDVLTFKEVLSKAAADGSQSQAQVALDRIDTDFSGGSLRRTGNTLDVAIAGEGFFSVQTPNGEQYTRAGSFVRDSDGSLTTSSGLPVLGEHGPIIVHGDERLSIRENAEVWAGDRPVDRLRIVTLPTGGLRREGANLWSSPDATATVDETPTVHVGSIEQSNVNAVESMVEMIWVSRAHDSLQRAIEVFSEIDRKTANEIA